MKNLLNYFLILLFAGTIVSCSEDDEIKPLTEEQAKSKVLGMTSGTVISSDADTTTSGVVYFDIDVETTSGAIIEFEIFLETGELKEIEGDNGPFDYEVDPGMGLIKFSVAKAAALSARPGEVQRWSLEKDNSSGIWTYTFEILNGNQEDFTVKINATNGTIISS